MNKKGFTLIELLAVIVILGVILVIAIPSISAAILNSRKNSFVATANEFVDGARLITLNDPSKLPSTGTSIIPISEIKLEKGSSTKSPFGKTYTPDSGVYINYDDINQEYVYSIYLMDDGGNGIGSKTVNGGNTTINPVEIKAVTKDIIAVGGSIPEQEPEPEPEPEPTYVSNGLMLYLDGIDNNGVGNHSSSLTTWYDLSGNNYHFTAAATGTFSDKYYVSSNSNCWYLNTTVFNSLSAMTVEVVAQINNAGQGYSYIVANRSSGPVYNWMLGTKNNQYMPHGNAQYLDSVYFTYGTPFTAVMQVNNAYLKTYINNTISQTNTSFTYGSASAKILVGCYYTGATYSEYLYGRIYAVRIYNRALTEAELTNNHSLDVSRFDLSQ